MTAKVSVIVPVYNTEPYLRQCLDTLVNQSLKDIEVILVNDCSTDNSGVVCDEYAAKDKRVIVIHNKTNRGSSESRNTGIRLAKGEYLGFVDSDDWVDLVFFEKLYAAAKKNNVDIAKAERVIVFDNKRTALKDLKENKSIRKGNKRNNPVFLSFTDQHTTAIYKRDLLIKNGIYYPDINIAQDNVLILKAGYFARSIVLVSKTLYHYRKRPGSISSEKSQDYFNNIIQFLELSLEFINTHDMEKAHYDAVFLRSLKVAYKRCHQMDMTKLPANYRKEYLKNIVGLLGHYKYEHVDILEALLLGFRLKFIIKGKMRRMYYLLRLWVRENRTI